MLEVHKAYGTIMDIGIGYTAKTSNKSCHINFKNDFNTHIARVPQA